MCLITKQKKAKIAKEDIICYKELRDDAYSYIQFFKYILDKLYKVKISFVVIEDRYSSYLYPDSTSRDYYDDIIIGSDYTKNLIAVQRGFHSCNTFERSREYQKQVWNARLSTFKCIIPKGSEYYKDATGLLVSNQIIIKEKVQ